MSNRSKQQQQRRVQRSFKQRQRGNTSLGLATFVAFAALTLFMVGRAIRHDTTNTDLFIDRCEHQSGVAVPGVQRVLYCVKVDALLVPK